jgi:hypothetical protein
MLNYGYFHTLAHDDFSEALAKGRWRAIVSWLTRTPNSLLSFNDVRRRLPFKGQRDTGLQVIHTDQIIGSVGRWQEFDRAFLPRRLENSSRWISISRAYYQGTCLPPVELYKIGDAYFVKDGNHRISVARARGQVCIDAFVTEVDTIADFAFEPIA